MDRSRRAQRSPLVRMLSPLRDFLDAEASGAILLAVGAVAALVWVNSPWSASYETLWSTKTSFTVAGHALNLDFRQWINDGLMTIFFFVVGLEIKRELTDGHLSSRRSALLPFTAALGGMVVPALLYLAIAGRTAPRGWAIPMATDIALAVGVLAVAGSRVPSSMRAFLLGLAIVDDIGAIVIIAVVYSKGIGWGWLALGLGLVAAALAARRLGIQSTAVFVVFGIALWYSLHEGGVHPTIAGVVMGLLAPTAPRIHAEIVDVEQLTDISDAAAVQATTQLARDSVSVVEWLQHVLHPWTSYVIVPIFALANSGIDIDGHDVGRALRSPITWAIVVGLVVGKPIGVLATTRLAVRFGVADAPDGSTPRQFLGIGTAAGIGFTVALFITELAFRDPAQRAEAKLAILAASLIAASLSCLVLMTQHRDVDGTMVP